MQKQLILMYNPVYSHKCISKNDNSLITDEFRGEIFCSECGSVIAERMMESHSGNSFSAENYAKKTRIEGKTKLSSYDMGISGKIDKSNKDALGNTISKKMKYDFYRLRSWDARSKKFVPRSLVHGFEILDGVKTKLGLSESITEKGAYIFRKAVEQNLLKGRTVETMILASVYAACREVNAPRDLDDFVAVSNLKKRSLSKAYRHLVKRMDFEADPVDARGFVNRITTAAGLSEKTKRMAWKFLEESNKLGLSFGKKPSGMAGGAIYLASIINEEPISYKKLEYFSHCSDATMRKMTKMFIKNLKSPLLRRIKQYA